MKPIHLALCCSAVFLLLLVQACAHRPEIKDKELVFYLLDIHGMWGGLDIYVHSDDTGVVRKIGGRRNRSGGLPELRYLARLPAGSVEALRKLAVESGLKSYRQQRQLGVPDEAHPFLFWRISPTKTVQGNKWANDADARFDPVYQRLTKLADEAKRTATLYRGELDWDWRHPGRAED